MAKANGKKGHKALNQPEQSCADKELASDFRGRQAFWVGTKVFQLFGFYESGGKKILENLKVVSVVVRQLIGFCSRNFPLLNNGKPAQSSPSRG